MAAHSTKVSTATPGARPSAWFWIWLASFYAAWLAVVWLYDAWPLTVAHWPIAAAMSAGSYFAGSTPMGGGTVGFPVLVLLFGHETALGRDFSFAVQSIGMTSAAIYILSTRQPLALRMLGGSLLGALLGTPLGLTFIAPLVPGPMGKLLFAVVWASFGVLTLARLDTLSKQSGLLRASARTESLTGLAIGFFGGASVAAITGVGVDMIIYVVLVLARRADLRIGIPTSVVLMAATSTIGVLWQVWALDAAHPELFGHWLAAAPVVAVGAPFGALVVTKIGRKPTLMVVAVLCIGQFIWTLSQEYGQLGWLGSTLVVAALFVVYGMFNALIRWGDSLAGSVPEGAREEASAELRTASPPAAP